VLPQLAVTCKIEAECYYQTLVQVDSEVLRNRQLLVAAKPLCPMPRDTLITLTIRQKKTEKPTLRKIKRGASQRKMPTLLNHI